MTIADYHAERQARHEAAGLHPAEASAIASSETVRRFTAEVSPV